MLRARYPNDLSVDAKGRLQLPNRIREELGIEDGGTMEFHVGVLLDPCIYVHTEEQHERFLEAFEYVVDDTDHGRMLKTMVHARFAPVTNDRTGRINLSEKMRAEVGIEKEVVVVSMRDRLELWGAAKFAEMNEANELDFRKGLEAALGRVGDMRRAANNTHSDDG
jgi:transcriptional regulator MraZ